MTELRSADPLPEPLEPVRVSPLPEPSPEVEARIQRLAHAALHAAHAPPRMSRLEFALGSTLIVCYAAYAVTQIVLIFERVRS